VVSLPLAPGRAEVPAGGADAGGDDDDTGELSEDRPAIEPHFTR